MFVFRISGLFGCQLLRCGRQDPSSLAFWPVEGILHHICKSVTGTPGWQCCTKGCLPNCSGHEDKYPVVGQRTLKWGRFLQMNSSVISYWLSVRQELSHGMLESQLLHLLRMERNKAWIQGYRVSFSKFSAWSLCWDTAHKMLSVIFSLSRIN